MLSRSQGVEMSVLRNFGWIPIAALAFLAVLPAGALNMTTQRWENCDDIVGTLADYFSSSHSRIMFEHAKNIYVCLDGSNGYHLHVVDTSNGDTKWNTPTLCYGHIEPLINKDGIVIFGVEKDGAATLEARDLNHGTLKWAQEMWDDWRLHCAPVLSTNGETVFMMSSATNLTAFDASSGAMKWSYESTDESMVGDNTFGCFTKIPEASKVGWESRRRDNVQPEVFGSTIFLWSEKPRVNGSFNYSLNAIDTTTGNLKWEYKSPKMWSANFRGFKMLQSLDGYTAFLNTNPILALSVDTGTLKWDPVDCLPPRFTGGNCLLVMSEDGQTLFTFRNASSEQNELTALRTATGTPRWRLMFSKGRLIEFQKLLQSTDGSRLFYVDMSADQQNYTQTLFAVSTESGTLVWNRTLPQSRPIHSWETEMFLSGSGRTLCLYNAAAASFLSCFDAITGKTKSSLTESRGIFDHTFKIDFLDASSKMLLRYDKRTQDSSILVILLMDMDTGTILWQSSGERVQDLLPSKDGRTFYKLPKLREGEFGRLSAQALRCIGDICCPTEHEVAQNGGGCDPVAVQSDRCPDPANWALRSRLGLAAALLMLAVGLCDPLFRFPH